MRNNLTLLFSLVLLLAPISACKKISTPNEESKQIFGSWEYRSNSGGFSGGGGSTRFETDTWVEFSEKGCFTIYVGSKKKSKQGFKIEMRETIYSVDMKPNLVYKNTRESFLIWNDTLLLRDEAYDGYSYLFTRK